ncbi:MAG: class I SAM-dependent methyltransferase [Lachnospiraceae bacterium]|nr:class I SAM-dependent methyltransferase [Lachnospiraceae bacterium]
MGSELVKTEQGLILTDGELSLRGDFRQLLPRIRRGNLSREMLVKASRIRNAKSELTVLDATAGLGEDSFLLAAAGCQVLLYEKDPVIAALLADALRRAAEDPELRETAARMHFTEGDSIDAMREMAKENASSPDVILLDPMFPERNKSALVRKKFQLLHTLEKPCENEEELLEAAISARPRRIVVKRPLKGPYLAGRRPDYSLSGKAIRYDCFVFPP